MFFDRRSNRRYSIPRRLTYVLISDVGGSVKGAGRVVNASSSGVLFTTDRTFEIGSRIVLKIDWPGEQPRTKSDLIVSGRVVRSNGHATAIMIEHHEIRRKRGASPVGAFSVAQLSA